MMGHKTGYCVTFCQIYFLNLYFNSVHSQEYSPILSNQCIKNLPNIL